MRKLVALLRAVTAIGMVAISPSAAWAWAPASSATVHQGVMTFTEGAQCTSNFLYSDGSNTYIGQAAHCSGTGTATETDGCDSGSLPTGTPVGPPFPGTEGFAFATSAGSSFTSARSLYAQASGFVSPFACIVIHEL